MNDHYVVPERGARFVKRCLSMTCCIGLVAAFSVQAQEAEKIEPQAVAALEKMAAYFRVLKTFQVAVETTDEDVLEDGQKIQYASHFDVLVQFPNKARVDKSNDYVDRLTLYDGETFTLFAKRLNFYSTVPAPASIAELVSLLESKFDYRVPLANLVHWAEPGWEPTGITGAMDLGPSVVSGVTCQHYAFRQANIDWQIWIQKGDFPLPRKIVITTLTDDARPQHTASYKWNLAPSFSEDSFKMNPNTDASRVVLMDLSQLGNSDN
ncbi:MAG: hypothetical protein ACI909_002653 [Planctomycetota bacterium]|jgi:hypothetical protein